MVASSLSAGIVNQALAHIAAQASVVGAVPMLTGGGSASEYANVLYPQCVDMLLREQDYEFARVVGAPLTLAPGAATGGWSYAYIYPSDCLRLRQVTPAVPDANDPWPIGWNVANVVIGGTPTRVILCNITPALANYTTSSVTEAEWDSLFTEAMIRLLASELAIALGGRPDLGRAKLAEAGQIMSSAVGRDS